MKSKLVRVLVVILVLVVAAIAAGIGYIWYMDNHVFVDKTPYSIHAESLDLRDQDFAVSSFDQLHSQLPNCEILWSVPFQDGKVSSDVQELTIETLKETDITMLAYFPQLRRINAENCTDYTMLQTLQETYPHLQVDYQISLGSTALNPDAAEAELLPQEYTFDTLLENLQYLPKLSSLKLKMSAITQEELAQLREAYPDKEISCTVELLGNEYDTDTTELDLSAMTSEDVAEAAEKLGMLPNLQSIELMDAEGVSQLSMEDAKTLKASAGEVSLHYSFDFFGDTISTTDEEVYISNKKIGDDGLDQVRTAVELMENCTRFVLENCGISNERLAELREEYREKTKIVWRITFGKRGSCLTDREVIKAVYGLDDDNCGALIYCEDAKFIDVGHNEYLDAVPFVASMTNLEAIIISGSPVKDLTPFENCVNLKFLEMGFCGYVEDLTPLANCEKLEMLNISYTKVSDLSPLDNLPLTMLCAKSAKVPVEEQSRYAQDHPDCWAQYTGTQPYGVGWRYDEENKALPYYEMLREIFEYDKIANYTTW